MSTQAIRIFLCAILVALLAAPIMAAEPTGDDPDSWRQHLLEHRFEEAATKELAAKKKLRMEAEKTVNQERFDVTYYGLDLTLTPSSQNLTGTVTVNALVTGTSLSILDLNLSYDMSVTGATSAGQAAAYNHSNNLVTVTLDRTYNEGEVVTITVSYSGNPAGEAFGWSSYSGQSMIWTLSEPYGARDWWPCKDLNTDKADSMDIIVTVPSHLIVASQGLLQSNELNGSWRTFHWKTNYPTVPYLVSLAIYPYSQYSDWYTPLAGGDPMEVQFYVFPDHMDDVQENYALTVPMIGAFAEAFGEYPFVAEKYGHAEFLWGGGMEHQTISSMGAWSEDLISHELGHQWWGDMVTCADFGHIWLNEGFATWGEAYWAETEYNFSTYQEYMAIASYYGGGTIFVEDPQNDNIFDGNLSYNKGSWVVHMLRGVLGDEDFFAGLRQYRADFEYGSATTEDLQAVLEGISGRDLTAFFQQWIYGEYFPIYEMTYSQAPGASEVTVTLNQVQDNAGLFTMPVPLRITTDQGVVDVRVENDQLVQEFVIAVSGDVESVVVDPDRWILRQVRTVVDNATLEDGVLLVNGVHWDTYGAELTNAYEAQAFWGDTPITFWDTFAEPVSGYPSTLPEPLGHGAVPAGVLGHYSTVIWVGNNYNGDLVNWAETPIRSYLEAGGNVLLMTRRSHSFLTGGLDDYLDVSFAESQENLGNCQAVDPDLVNIPFNGSQSWNDVYYYTWGAQSEPLFRDSMGFGSTRLTGVVTKPEEGGTFRPDGGRFALISARPYRLDLEALRQNVETILANHMLEPYEPGLAPVEEIPTAELPSVAQLGANYPNPFNPQTVIPFSLPRGGSVKLGVYDARGRLLKELANTSFAMGRHEVNWDGTDSQGRGLPSGLYFVRMASEGGVVQTRSMALVR